jgi:eukaryotic-like serine/threonine-protein kinase
MTPQSDDPVLEAQVRARVGTTLRGKYTLTGVLGIGGMAAVYSATHRNGRQVAVKLLHPQLSTNAEARTRFAREGLVANTVRHPGVVAVLDDDVTDDGAAFLVMELLEGASIEELWERHGQRLPLPAVMAVGIALLDVLSAAHAAGVVHRDVKPANVFLTHGWQVKVLDFGISRMAQASVASTQTGMMLGSPAFMAPEQALGRTNEIDGRTDVWAAAATLFTLASGSYVHAGQNSNEMLIHAATTQVRSLAEALPGVPGLISAVVDRALAFSKEDRWGSAAEMAVALSEASRASFGEEPSVGAFATVLAFVPPAVLATPMPMRPSSFPPPNVSTQLTSSTSGSTRPGPMAAPRKRTLILGGVAALGLLVGFVFVLARISSGSRANASASGIVQQPISPAAAVVDTPSAPASAVDTARVAQPAPPVSGPVAPEAILQATPKTAPKSASAPTQRPGSTKPAVPGVTPPKTFLPPPPAAPVDPCNPPYRYDFFGNKVQKPGC